MPTSALPPFGPETSPLTRCDEGSICGCVKHPPYPITVAGYARRVIGGTIALNTQTKPVTASGWKDSQIDPESGDADLSLYVVSETPDALGHGTLKVAIHLAFTEGGAWLRCRHVRGGALRPGFIRVLIGNVIKSRTSSSASKSISMSPLVMKNSPSFF